MGKPVTSSVIRVVAYTQCERLEAQDWTRSQDICYCQTASSRRLLDPAGTAYSTVRNVSEGDRQPGLLHRRSLRHGDRRGCAHAAREEAGNALLSEPCDTLVQDALQTVICRSSRKGQMGRSKVSILSLTD